MSQEISEEKSAGVELSVECAFEKIGGFGWAQKTYSFLIGNLTLWIAFHQLLTVFVGLEPSFKCYSKDGSNQNKPLVDQCIDDSPEKCAIHYTTNYTSFAAEWNLICRDKYKVALVQSVWMAGVMAGALFLGSVADIVGRLKTLMVSLIGVIAFEGFSAFAPTYTIMIAIRFFGGMSCAVLILSSFVLSQELIGSKWRSFCGLGVGMFFSVGIGVFALIAANTDNWRILTLICSTSGIIFLILPCYIPESPRWLAVQGRLSEARGVLELIARKNGTYDDLPRKWELANPGGKESKDKKSRGVRDLASHPYILILTLIQIYSWFVNSATYYGLTMAASDLGSNVYISTALSGIIELPAGFLAIFVVDRIGRRITLCGFMLIGGLACVLIQLIPSRLTMVTTTLALCGKLSISGSFSICYIHSAEIFPTPIRNSGMGIVSVAARIGGILAPFILMLGDVLPNLQFSALGLMTFLAGALNMKLPETLGQPMPESVKDVLALRSPLKVVVNNDFKYDRLEMDDDENEVTEFVRSRSPDALTKRDVKDEDQVPLIED